MGSLRASMRKTNRAFWNFFFFSMFARLRTLLDRTSATPPPPSLSAGTHPLKEDSTALEQTASGSKSSFLDIEVPQNLESTAEADTMVATRRSAVGLAKPLDDPEQKVHHGGAKKRASVGKADSRSTKRMNSGDENGTQEEDADGTDIPADHLDSLPLQAQNAVNDGAADAENINDVEMADVEPASSLPTGRAEEYVNGTTVSPDLPSQSNATTTASAAVPTTLTSQTTAHIRFSSASPPPPTLGPLHHSDDDHSNDDGSDDEAPEQLSTTAAHELATLSTLSALHSRTHRAKTDKASRRALDARLKEQSRRRKHSSTIGTTDNADEPNPSTSTDLPEALLASIPHSRPLIVPAPAASITATTTTTTTAAAAGNVSHKRSRLHDGTETEESKRRLHAYKAADRPLKRGSIDVQVLRRANAPGSVLAPRGGVDAVAKGVRERWLTGRRGTTTTSSSGASTGAKGRGSNGGGIAKGRRGALAGRGIDLKARVERRPVGKKRFLVGRI